MPWFCPGGNHFPPTFLVLPFLVSALLNSGYLWEIIERTKCKCQWKVHIIGTNPQMTRIIFLKDDPGCGEKMFQNKPYWCLSWSWITHLSQPILFFTLVYVYELYTYVYKQMCPVFPWTVSIWGQRLHFNMPVCSVVSNSATPQTAACQALLSVEFSRQEYWSGLLFPPPEDLPNPGIETASLTSSALAGNS